MTPSATAVVMAAGAAVVVGAVGAVVVHRVARRSPAWAAALAPATAVLSVAAGVVAASATMLLGPEQVRIVALVLVVATPIAIGFGALLARQVQRLQAEAAEQRAARERDAAVEERRRALISWLSHDLRSPLARMRVLAEAAEDGLAPADFPQLIGREVDALSHIVDDISALSRLQGSVTLDRQPTDLQDLTSDAVAAAQPFARSRGVHLAGGGSTAIPVTADAAELSRALHNLIGNGLRHTPAGGTVRVESGSDSQHARVTVADQCGGIPVEHLGHLFEPGWRGTSARTPGDGGAGLGLAIARSIVEAHQGSLSVANTDDGCCFTLTLPITGRMADDVAVPAPDYPSVGAGPPPSDSADPRSSSHGRNS